MTGSASRGVPTLLRGTSQAFRVHLDGPSGQVASLSVQADLFGADLVELLQQKRKTSGSARADPLSLVDIDFLLPVRKPRTVVPLAGDGGGWRSAGLHPRGRGDTQTDHFGAGAAK